MSPQIPSQHRALVLSERGQPLTVETRPTPRPGPGSVLLRILAASVRSNAPDVLQDPNSSHPLPVPLVPGFIAIGRVAEAGPDAASLAPGQLVFFDPFIKSRDGSSAKYVCGFMELLDQGSRTLSRGEWRDSTFAEYAKLPLENCHALDEQRLMGPAEEGGLGYSLEDLTHLFSMLIPYGGLADIDVKPGESVIIAPATGRYGSAAVHVALAMGARVIAVGRNATVLSQLDALGPRVSTLRNTGDAEADAESLRSVAPGGVDAFWDMSPPAAGTSSHFQSALSVLKHGARVTLMGSVPSGVSFGYMQILMGGLTIKGTWMATREQTRRLIAMAESGVLPLGAAAGMGPVRGFRLEEWKEALETAAEKIEPGEVVFMT